MAPLSTELRRPLENAIVAARDAAEDAADKALDTLGVKLERVPTTLNADQRRLRNALRARARQLGSGDLLDGMPFLIEEVAYEQWHRMLFARFLAENDLLIHSEHQIPVTLDECAELAPEEGEADAWQLAARYASAMLPGIFRLDDPSAQVRLTPEGRQELERILSDLPAPLFRADDALGWVYQFWQSKRKKEVNASERKIGGADLPPVTQLFTEDYMVRFLLENSLGAWWAARHPRSPLIKEFKYLRFLEDGTPAAGTFPGWPDRAALITMMDPCCGSGHFDVAAFEMLRRMRMEEEGLSAAEAADATLRDNIFGLELDPRCTQIAAFALALAAWKAGGYRPLPVPNIACSGIPVEGQLETWTKLAGKDENLRAALERLYHLFRNAPNLGSLINPTDVPERDRMFMPDYNKVAPLLETALRKERDVNDPVSAVFGAAAKDVVHVANLLANTYTLVGTNVPYLGQRKQGDILREFCEDHYTNEKADLAAAFVSRCVSFAQMGCNVALVIPHGLLYKTSYSSFRCNLVQSTCLNLVNILGPRAFEEIGGEVVDVALLNISRASPHSNITRGMDLSKTTTAQEKSFLLRQHALAEIEQRKFGNQGRCNISITTLAQEEDSTLTDIAIAPQGIKTGDDAKWLRKFWETPDAGSNNWRFCQTAPSKSDLYTGREQVIDWRTSGKGMIRPRLDSPAVGQRGVVISQTGTHFVTMYTGELFDSSAAPIIPSNPRHVEAIWSFCKSAEYQHALSSRVPGLHATNSTILDVPFDLKHWQNATKQISSLPEPSSTDPTQWLFDGHLATSNNPLMVAVARLLYYCWPKQAQDKLDQFSDADGIVSLPAVSRESPAAERLRAVLAAAYGKDWSAVLQSRLLKEVGYASLEEWLRDGFFGQHCSLFQNRPFIWHVWDGRKDGFSALVNYHKLDHEKLGKLIYTYLGDWIKTQRAERDAGIAGADGRIVAALDLQKKLEAIREGEPPYDIYVRWKPLHQQPIGWNPDLNDGVRLNIRPFVEAGALRSKFTINWNKDRGKNPDGSERLNDLHYSIAQKQAARRKAGK